MWIPKGERDLKKGVDSPMPTQVVSNEEFVPRRQTDAQRKVEQLIGQKSADNSRRLGMTTRDFMRTSMGLATCFWASNQVHGEVWDVDEAETLEAAATEEKWPKGEYLVFDIQAHFTNGYALGFRNNPVITGMSFNLKEDPEAYSYKTFVKEMFFDSETDMLMISGVPTMENLRDKDGKVLEGQARSKGLLPSWLMAKARDEINALSGSQRAWAQGNLAPNHYWDRTANKMNRAACLEQMEREISNYKISSWKWYCHFDPGRSGGGFQCDDDNAQWFIEESKKRGLKMFSVHKGFSAQSKTLGHLANPKDLEKMALRNPDVTIICYHSALQHSPGEPEYKDPKNYDQTTGDFAWHNILMDIKRRNPGMNNLYCEIGSMFGLLAIHDPIMCMHGIGKNIKYYGSDHVLWGTDCLWWGSPQWVIDAFKRFQISDELCEKFGYKKITREDKARIFGLNSAKIFGIDVNKKRNPLPADALDRLRVAYHEHGGQRDNYGHGWVRADD
jgi:predicted TIM-barrel fold metal-dependent hydrolase